MQLRWSHALVKVRDLDAMVDFYTEVLGFEVTDRGALAPGGPEAVFMSQVETDHHQLAFAALREGDDPPNSVDHFAFRVASLDDVRELAERLKSDGRAEKLTPITHGNAWSVYFRDPEDNGIEVFCDTPWHVAQPQIRGWDMALGDAELEAATRADFEGEPAFGPIDAFYARRAKELEQR